MKKYHILYTKLKEDILSGKYEKNKKLPSKRNMSDSTGYSLITVEKAYGMLEDEGYIFAEERKGYFVSELDFQGNNLSDNSKKINRLEIPDDHPNSNFEYSVWFRTIRKVIADNDDRLFVKSPSKGCEILRNAIADYLLRYRGMTAQPSNIIIGSGAEQLYETAAKILGRDKIFGIENPCYHQILTVYEGIGVKVCPLNMGNDGISSKELKEKHFDALHVTPFHSYPTGISTSVSKKYKYLKWANETGNYIIEDDFDSEFFLPGHPIETLYSLDGSDSVIYINTFSKSLSPAMRIGYIILPDKLMPEYEKKLGRLSCTVPVMDQYILAEFISSGSFERHLNSMRRKINKSLSNTHHKNL